MSKEKPAYPGVEAETLSFQELMFLGLVASGTLKLEPEGDDSQTRIKNLSVLRDAWHTVRGQVSLWEEQDRELRNKREQG